MPLIAVRTLEKNNAKMVIESAKRHLLHTTEYLLHILHVLSHYILTTVLQDNRYFPVPCRTDAGRKGYKDINHISQGHRKSKEC